MYVNEKDRGLGKGWRGVCLTACINLQVGKRGSGGFERNVG